jgi:hypothetical protein
MVCIDDPRVRHKKIKMTLYPKSIIVGIGSSIILKTILASYWGPLVLSIVAATKIDKNIDHRIGLIYGLIIGLIVTPYSIWIDGKDFGPFTDAILGILMMSVLAGLIGALFGRIFKGNSSFIW